MKTKEIILNKLKDNLDLNDLLAEEFDKVNSVIAELDTKIPSTEAEADKKELLIKRGVHVTKNSLIQQQLRSCIDNIVLLYEVAALSNISLDGDLSEEDKRKVTIYSEQNKVTFVVDKGKIQYRDSDLEKGIEEHMKNYFEQK